MATPGRHSTIPPNTYGATERARGASPLVEKAYKRGELSGQDYALLLDRVLVGEGKPQVYGTQAKRFEEGKGREPVLEPIEDGVTWINVGQKSV